ncbi:MAG: hypothetical protein GWO16_10755, partial [Gammaproteobacteria bacterium]|nr:hypothetical protein [Gammaproteobacteria bacterium]NIR98700.1 hypothetical protein [Gammaproteobacteria bacterium]NIT64416.1 hypothetical protein [Gammaproteobacteria bacterium]NIV21146.1 hypothetical protein [Gammaproteobacteria bacterium]NIY32996.1 hypothetical protein [Gammaproteobacteria bacterium]
PPLSAVTAVEVETLPDDPGLPGEGFAIRR